MRRSINIKKDSFFLISRTWAILNFPVLKTKQKLQKDEWEREGERETETQTKVSPRRRVCPCPGSTLEFLSSRVRQSSLANQSPQFRLKSETGNLASMSAENLIRIMNTIFPIFVKIKLRMKIFSSSIIEHLDICCWRFLFPFIFMILIQSFCSFAVGFPHTQTQHCFKHTTLQKLYLTILIQENLIEDDPKKW